MDLESKIEAVLFFKGEPVSRKRLAEILKVSPEDLDMALAGLRASLVGRGIVLQEKDNDVTLGTAPAVSEMIEILQKEELNRDLSKASLETLSIILYKNGASRAEIDYIRGVNSSFTLRALSVRGLVERVLDPTDSRRYLYRPTFETLSYLGVKSVEELPEWNEVKIGMDTAAKNFEEETKNENGSAN